MPEPVYFNDETNALHCRTCDNRYDPQIEGMIRGIECCHSLDDVDRDDIPIGPLNLKRSPEEVRESPHSAAKLRMLQAVYNGTQERTHPLEYDLLRDSMLRLQEYVGIDTEEVQELLEEGLLRQDDHPFRLYTVTPEGRAAIGESYREGVDYGHGKGDLEESSKHVMGVRCAARWVEAEFQDDPDSEVVRVEMYYDIGGNQRLDVVGLDANDVIVLTVEVERVNHDVRRAVPEDFDKMAACEPQEAIWVAMSHTEAHTILSALNDPLDGEPRVSKTYSEGTPANDFLIDEPGCTGMVTLDQIRDRLGLD